jgi:WD40 repeat protein
LPRLREQGPWIVVALRPGRRPLASLAAAVLNVEHKSTPAAASGRTPSSDWPAAANGSDRREQRSDRPRPDSGPPRQAATTSEQIEQRALELSDEPASLASALRQLAAKHGAQVLLFVDQLEEAYSLASDERERQQFLAAIALAADDVREAVRAVFTLRDDFMGKLASVAEMREALTHVVVLRAPGPDVLQDVIVKPLAALGVGFDDSELPKRMVDAVRGEAAALPLLEFAADLLWDRRDVEHHLVRADAYQAMGGVAGALAAHADSVLDELGAEHERTVRELLLRLVTPDRTRRLVATAELTDGLGDAAGTVVAKLSEARLLTVRRSKGAGENAEPEMELVHESLLGTWTRLARWIDESREDLVFLSEARDAAERWSRRGRQGEQLWHGQTLAEAEIAARRLGERLPAAVREFLAACRALAARQKRRRAIGLGVLVAMLSAVALGSVRVAIVLRERERVAVDAKNAALEARKASVEREAMAELAAAKSAFGRKDMLEARTRLRRSLELGDSQAGRGLWAKLQSEPELWRVALGLAPFGMAYLPDGKTVATAGSDGSVYLVDTATAATEQLRGPGSAAHALAARGDGRQVAARFANGTLCWWDLASRDRHCVRPHGDIGAFASLAYSRDGGAIWTLGRAPKHDERVHLVRTELPSGTMTDRALDASVQANDTHDWLELSPDGRVIVISNGARVLLLRTSDLGLEHELSGHQALVNAAVFSLDGSRLVTVAQDHTMRLWNVATGSEVGQSPTDLTEFPVARAVSPSGDWFAVGHAEGKLTVRRWDDLANATALKLFPESWVSGVAFDPTGELVAAAGSFDNALVLARWRATLERRHTPRRAPGQTALAFSFSGDSRHLTVGLKGGELKTIDLESARIEGTLQTGSPYVWSLKQARGGASLASCALNEKVSVYDSAAGRLLYSPPGPAGCISLAVDATGTVLAAAGLMADGSGGVTVVDIRTGAVRAELPTENRRVARGAAFSPDGRLLAVASGTAGALRLYDTSTWRERAPLPVETSCLNVDWSPDGRLLACSQRNALEVRSADGKGQRRFELPFGWTLAFKPAFHPDSRRVAACGRAGNARVLDLETGSFVELRGHAPDADVNQIAFSPDGKLVATSSDDGTVRTWHPDDGRPYWWAPLLEATAHRLHTHRGWVDLDTPNAEPVADVHAWEKALRDEARVASASDADAHLCIGTHQGALAIWDRDRDAQVASTKLEALSAVLAVPRGCATLGAGEAKLFLVAAGAGGGSKTLAAKATALGFADGILLVAGPDGIAGFDASGAEVLRLPGREGLSAVSVAKGYLVLGHASGIVELVARDGGKGAGPELEGRFGSPVVSLTAGPHGLLAAGHADGTVLVWDMDTGALLETEYLHGAAIHVAFVGEKLYAASDLEDHVAFDVAAYGRDYCELMREVWREQPGTWEGGRPVRRGAPDDHRCR